MAENPESGFKHGKSRPGAIIAGIAIIVAIGAVWLSLVGTDDTETAQATSRPESLHGPTDRHSDTTGPGTETGAATSADQSTDAPAANAVHDDAIDIALGGSWDSADCTFVTRQVVRQPGNELVEAVECQRNSPKPVHPYESYADEALEALVHADPIAGIVLGRRVAATQPDKAWDLMIRSSALLGGDTRPIRWLATHSFNRVMTNGEIATGTIQIRYVLDSLTKRLEGSPDQSFDFRASHLRDSLSEAEFDRLDRMVDALIDKMKVIEKETTGKSSIQG